LSEIKGKKLNLIYSLAGPGPPEARLDSRF